MDLPNQEQTNAVSVAACEGSHRLMHIHMCTLTGVITQQREHTHVHTHRSEHTAERTHSHIHIVMYTHIIQEWACSRESTNLPNV